MNEINPKDSQRFQFLYLFYFNVGNLHNAQLRPGESVESIDDTHADPASPQYLQPSYQVGYRFGLDSMLG